MSRIFESLASALADARRQDLLEEARRARLAREAAAPAPDTTRRPVRDDGLVRRARGAPAC